MVILPVKVEVGTIVYVAEVPKFNGPSIDKSHVDLPETLGEIVNAPKLVAAGSENALGLSCNSASVAIIVKLYVVADATGIEPLNNPPLDSVIPLGKLLPACNAYVVALVAFNCTL
jgi:hypothetical protein